MGLVGNVDRQANSRIALREAKFASLAPINWAKRVERPQTHAV